MCNLWEDWRKIRVSEEILECTSVICWINERKLRWKAFKMNKDSTAEVVLDRKWQRFRKRGISLTKNAR